jgi:ABC-type antimicrobial peptide transport system permease subunit
MRLLRSMLYGVSATDPATFAAASLFLLAVSAVAAYLPARRAAGVDPNVALHHE